MSCPSCGTLIVASAFFGHYQGVRRLASGGLGDVIEAVDSVTGRKVAIKTLRNQIFGNPQFVAQFAREAAILANLAHPNIAEVYEFFQLGGALFLAMEYVEGGSLLDRIRLHGRVPERDLLRIGIDVVRGLTAALAKGVLHRDVKPANILFDAYGRAKLVDFGLAMSVGESVAGMGGQWGSPYYVPPERLDGDPEDFLGDMYSLGVTLFHAAAGRTPFQATSASVMAWKHLKSQHVSAKTFAAHLSDGTVTLINRCKARRPADRFPNYFELLDALESAEKRLIFARPGKATTQDLMGAARESAWSLRWVGIATVTMLLIAGGILALTSHSRGPDFDDPLAATANPGPSGTGTDAPSHDAVENAALAVGLLGHWKLDEGLGARTTQARDATGNGRHATLTQMSPALCWDDGALHFNACGFVQCPPLDVAPSPKGSFSVAFWIKFDDVGDGTPAVVSNNNASWHAKGWYICANEPRSIGMYLWTMDKPSDGDSPPTGMGSWTSPLEPGVWTHIAYVVDRENGVLDRYRNGQLESSSDIPIGFGDVDTPFGPRIGSPSLKAQMRDVRLYARPLRRNEAGDLSTQTAPSKHPSPAKVP